MEIKINKRMALKTLLSDKYLGEFEVIDGLSQHPARLNFYEWLLEKKIITEKEYFRVSEKAAREFDEYSDAHSCSANAEWNDDGPQGEGNYCTECGKLVFYSTT